MAALPGMLSAAECLHLERQRFRAAQAALPDDDDLADASVWDSLDLADAVSDALHAAPEPLSHCSVEHKDALAEAECSAAAPGAPSQQGPAKEDADAGACEGLPESEALAEAVNALLAQCDEVRALCQQPGCWCPCGLSARLVAAAARLRSAS